MSGAEIAVPITTRFVGGPDLVQVGSIMLPPGTYMVTAWMGRQGSSATATLRIRLYSDPDTDVAVLTRTSNPAATGPTEPFTISGTAPMLVRFHLQSSNRHGTAVCEAIGVSTV